MFTYRRAKQVVVLVIGATLLIIGLALLVLPGPGLLVLYLGLFMLASEFVWARRWLHKIKQRLDPVAARSASLWQRCRIRWLTRRGAASDETV